MDETHILTSSENTNNENREKELSGFQPESESTDQNEGTDESGNQETNQSISELSAKSNNDNEIDTSGCINQQKENDDKHKVVTTEKENKENEEKDKEDKEIEDTNKSSNSQTNNDVNDADEYSKHVTYNELGEAIYTDPITKYKYRWSEDKNDWELLESSSVSTNETTTTTATVNPYENEHYRWCSERNQWIPKLKKEESGKTEEKSSGTTATSTGTETIENEYYRWDKETNQWIPKIQSSNVVTGYEDGVHTYTDQDGTVFFWDTEKNAWFPKIDDEFMARYQLNYGFIDNTTSPGENNKEIKSTNTVSTARQEDIELSSQQAADVGVGEGDDGKNLTKTLKRKVVEPPKWFDLPPEQNTKVYVSNLPEDITEEEFIQVMSKCGLIMRDPQTQKYKIKLYTDSNGQLKGDGLCDYIRVESVDLALNLLDGCDVRGRKIKIQRAKFEMRGEYNPALKPKRKKKDKEKLQKMKERLFDWRPEKLRGERSKHERIVIIKNLFDPELFDKEVQLIIEYQNDLREECSKCGKVKKVVIFDRHPDGVAQVTMSSPEEADLVVQMMNRRFFSQRRLIAEIWDGKTKYKIAETEEEIQKRISNWDKYLEERDAEKEKQQSDHAANNTSEMNPTNDKLEA